MDDNITSYYQQNATDFFLETVGVDMAPLYERFLPRIPQEGHILDAGCGSGRDSRFFRECGYKVTAFDASPDLARLATDHADLPVLVLRFQDLTWQRIFDGIWACASLLHVPADELVDAVRRLAAALKPTGILYTSFKYGHGECDRNGRRYTDLDERGLYLVLQQVGTLEPLDMWTTVDRRPGRGEERWINCIAGAMR